MENSPKVKFENSPAESFVSTPGTMYPPLFNNDSLDAEGMTPQSYEDDSMFGGSLDGSMAGTPAPEKKPVKKRKSWGQQLPEPKTNLPPRKRAKTEDEKEQRRVERVLRNRRAAQSSRERKRQEVELLEEQKMAVERRNKDLEMRMADLEAKNQMLERELKKLGGDITIFNAGSVTSTPIKVESIRQVSTPVTFSQDLFGSRDTDTLPISTQSLPQPIPQTVNPASLSPEMRPVADFTNASSSDMTQHPAAMLCDLQCQSEEQRPWMKTSTVSQILAMTMLINMASTACLTFLTPLRQIMTSLQTGSTLPSTNSILTLIIWLTTTTASLKTMTTVNSSSTTTSLRPRFSLRIRLLRRLLACSPNLARPLMDATMVAMRSASEQQLPNCLSSADASRLDTSNSPSIEALMTLLWAIHLIEKEQIGQTPELDAASGVRQEMELNELFRPRELKGVSFVSRHGKVGNYGQKSLGGRRTGV